MVTGSTARDSLDRVVAVLPSARPRRSFVQALESIAPELLRTSATTRSALRSGADPQRRKGSSVTRFECPQVLWRAEDLPVSGA